MGFRNPKYLDVPMLLNVADYYGIELPPDAEVTRRTVDQRRGHAGVGKGLDIGAEKGTEREITEVFNTQARPVRAMNDVIDALLQDGNVVDFASAEAPVTSQRDLLQVEGALSLHPATEMGAILGAVLPSLFDQLAAGNDDPVLDASQLARLLTGQDSPPNVPYIFELDHEHQAATGPIFVLTQPSFLFDPATMDDLDDDSTVFASVERVIGIDRTYSLEKYLLPGLNRTARRAIGEKDVGEMLGSFSELMGKDMGLSEITIKGPALLVRAIAIF